MTWDAAKIEESISTLVDALGQTCCVRIEISRETRETTPTTDDKGIPWREFEFIPNSKMAIITITEKR